MIKCLNSLKFHWHSFCEADIEKKMSIIGFLSLCFFFFDCSLTGGGHYLAVGPLTPRFAAAFVALACSIPVILKSIRKYVNNPIVLMVVAFAVYLIICAVRGYLAKNRMNVLISDIKGFAWLFMVPVVMAILNSKERFRCILNCVIAGSVLQACFVLTVNAVCTVVPEGIKIFYQPVNDALIGTVSSVSKNVFRIFMKSSPYMVFSCGVLVYRQVFCKKIKLKYILMVAIYLNALLLSFTRSVYGCVFVVLVCVLLAVVILRRNAIFRCLKFLLIAGAVTLCLVVIQEFLLGGNYINFAISRTFGTEVAKSPIVEFRGEILDKYEENSDSDAHRNHAVSSDSEIWGQEHYIDLTEKSDNIRAQTKKELIAIICQNPVFGSGLGASAPSRESGLDEYFYLDVLARMGIVGLILYVLPFVYILILCARKRNGITAFTDGTCALCGMMGFWAVTWFNPWMNAVLGIACYALCTAIPQHLTETECTEKENTV